MAAFSRLPSARPSGVPSVPSAPRVDVTVFSSPVRRRSRVSTESGSNDDMHHDLVHLVDDDDDVPVPWMSRGGHRSTHESAGVPGDPGPLASPDGGRRQSDWASDSAGEDDTGRTSHRSVRDRDGERHDSHWTGMHEGGNIDSALGDSPDSMGVSSAPQYQHQHQPSSRAVASEARVAVRVSGSNSGVPSHETVDMEASIDVPRSVAATPSPARQRVPRLSLDRLSSPARRGLVPAALDASPRSSVSPRQLASPSSPMSVAAVTPASPLHRASALSPGAGLRHRHQDREPRLVDISPSLMSSVSSDVVDSPVQRAVDVSAAASASGDDDEDDVDVGGAVASGGGDNDDRDDDDGGALEASSPDEPRRSVDAPRGSPSSLLPALHSTAHASPRLMPLQRRQRRRRRPPPLDTVQCLDSSAPSSPQSPHASSPHLRIGLMLSRDAVMMDAERDSHSQIDAVLLSTALDATARVSALEQQQPLTIAAPTGGRRKRRFSSDHLVSSRGDGTSISTSSAARVSSLDQSSARHPSSPMSTRSLLAVPEYDPLDADQLTAPMSASTVLLAAPSPAPSSSMQLPTATSTPPATRDAAALTMAATPTASAAWSAPLHSDVVLASSSAASPFPSPILAGDNGARATSLPLQHARPSAKSLGKRPAHPALRAGMLEMMRPSRRAAAEDEDDEDEDDAFDLAPSAGRTSPVPRGQLLLDLATLPAVPPAEEATASVCAADADRFTDIDGLTDIVEDLDDTVLSDVDEDREEQVVEQEEVADEEGEIDHRLHQQSGDVTAADQRASNGAMDEERFSPRFSPRPGPSTLAATSPPPSYDVPHVLIDDYAQAERSGSLTARSVGNDNDPGSLSVGVLPDTAPFISEGVAYRYEQADNGVLLKYRINIETGREKVVKRYRFEATQSGTLRPVRLRPGVKEDLPVPSSSVTAAAASAVSAAYVPPRIQYGAERVRNAVPAIPPGMYFAYGFPAYRRLLAHPYARPDHHLPLRRFCYGAPRDVTASTAASMLPASRYAYGFTAAEEGRPSAPAM